MESKVITSLNNAQAKRKKFTGVWRGLVNYKNNCFVNAAFNITLCFDYELLKFALNTTSDIKKYAQVTNTKTLIGLAFIVTAMEVFCAETNQPFKPELLAVYKKFMFLNNLINIDRS
jgi:hypothetical protein